MPLKKTAVEQNAQFTALDEVLTSGDFARGTAEGEFHEKSLLVFRQGTVIKSSVKWQEEQGDSNRSAGL
jgi:hypothetical protein